MPILYIGRMVFKGQLELFDARFDSVKKCDLIPFIFNWSFYICKLNIIFIFWVVPLGGILIFDSLNLIPKIWHFYCTIFSWLAYLKNTLNFRHCDTRVQFRKECKMCDFILQYYTLKIWISVRYSIVPNWQCCIIGIAAGADQMKYNSALFGAVGSGVRVTLNCESLEVFTAVQLRIPVLCDVMGSVHQTFWMNLPCNAASHPRRPEPLVSIS
jgi:hypothetical protein